MNSVENDRSFAEILATIREELREFVQTRMSLFKLELQEKLKTLKIAAPLAAIAGLLLATAYLLLTLALVALVAALFGKSPYHWVFGFLTVGVLWFILGGVAAFFAKREFAMKELLPKRTIEVLRGDKIWIQSEATRHDHTLD